MNPVVVFAYFGYGPDNSVYMAVVQCLEYRGNVCCIKLGKFFEK